MAGISVALAGFAVLSVVRPRVGFQWSFIGTGLLLLVWAGIVFRSAHHAGRVVWLQVAPRAQHYVQACAQCVFLLYWGWYWRPVYDFAVLIAAQVVFAYGFDILLCWSRRDSYRLGGGPLPIVLSINLFLWFRDDWFYLQFLLIAIGFLAKELIRWDRDGRQVHIFNPSSFPLALVSLALIVTGTTDVTWAQDIAITQFYPPHVYLVVFLVALPGQYLFGVTSMTMSAVVVTYLFGLIYFAWTGVYFFYDSYVPIAVFLGMHLLFTDPSTSPRSESGRVVYGALYGLSTVGLYAVLAWARVPPFYDKLLQVPVLNLSIHALDRLARCRWLRVTSPAIEERFASPRRRNLASLACWVVMFGALVAVGGVGDSHPGQWVPFWQNACNEGRAGACQYLGDMHRRFCQSGSGWACNEVGVLQVADATVVRDAFDRGCSLGFEPACRNQMRLSSRVDVLERSPPTVADYPIILRGTKGRITDLADADLRRRACRQGWAEICGRPLDD